MELQNPAVFPTHLEADLSRMSLIFFTISCHLQKRDNFSIKTLLGGNSINNHSSGMRNKLLQAAPLMLVWKYERLQSSY